MDESSEATEPTTDDTAVAQVPNITDNARSGLDHEPLERKPSTLIGSAARRDEDEAVPDDDEHDPEGAESRQASETSETGAEREALDTGANEAEQPDGSVADLGEQTATGDGSGDALPPVDESQSIQTPGEGTDEESPGAAGDGDPALGDSQS